MNKQKRNQGVAGLLYLVVAITGFFSTYVNAKLIVKGNAIATTQNIVESDRLFRGSIINDLVMAVSWILLAYVLYTLFETFNKNLGLLMISFVLAGAVIVCMNVLNKWIVWFILNEHGNILHQAMLFIDVYRGGNYIAHIFFGFWLFPLGYLVYKSNFIPRSIGILLIIAGLGYLIDFFIYFSLPNVELRITRFTFWGEVLLLIMLLYNGLRPQIGDEVLDEEI